MPLPQFPSMDIWACAATRATQTVTVARYIEHTIFVRRESSCWRKCRRDYIFETNLVLYITTFHAKNISVCSSNIRSRLH